ncbi:hypothetical protein [Phascolarctobacterium sp.]|uniref:hypothetical protein n=1 Tax=Phascolarctobacterium sp. TaxID=2049039 RepID=UPI00386D9B7B
MNREENIKAVIGGIYDSKVNSIAKMYIKVPAWDSAESDKEKILFYNSLLYCDQGVFVRDNHIDGILENDVNHVLESMPDEEIKLIWLYINSRDEKEITKYSSLDFARIKSEVVYRMVRDIRLQTYESVHEYGQRIPDDILKRIIDEMIDSVIEQMKAITAKYDFGMDSMYTELCYVRMFVDNDNRYEYNETDSKRDNIYSQAYEFVNRSIGYFMYKYIEKQYADKSETITDSLDDYARMNGKDGLVNYVYDMLMNRIDNEDSEAILAIRKQASN